MWSGIPISQNFPKFAVIHTVKGFGIVNKTKVDVFFWNSLDFSMIQQMLANFFLWFLCLFQNQLEHLEVHGSLTLKSGLENFEHY